MSWRDRIIGIVLGVILGIGVVVFFVFVYSGETVDAPSISDGAGGGRGGAGQPRSRPPPVATVRINGGAPPPSGPAELHYRKGALARLNVVSDVAERVELIGYGISRTVPAGKPTRIRFKASKAGNFALIVAPSHIDVARITIGGRAP
jgi:hypothetical protein